MTDEAITDPVTITVEGRADGWWVIGESSKGRKERGPFGMAEAINHQVKLVRKFKAEGRIR